MAQLPAKIIDQEPAAPAAAINRSQLARMASATSASSAKCCNYSTGKPACCSRACTLEGRRSWPHSRIR